MEPRLPPGLYLEFDPDLLVLRRGRKGEFVAAFSSRGATNESIKAAAWDDHRKQTSLEFIEPPTRNGHRSRHRRFIPHSSL
jgi:hypothetical protein